MNKETFLNKFSAQLETRRDIHITRFYSSFVCISNSEVISVTKPDMRHCPLAGYFYKSMRNLRGKAEQEVKAAIITAMREKISKFGFFSARRDLDIRDIVVPFGASEMIMYAMKRGIVDCAITVCDCAGTVITGNPQVVQGIGARMNGLFHTSPVKEVISELERRGATVLSREARIDQLAGLKKAIKEGYKKIAITVNGYLGENLREIRELEKKKKVRVYLIIVCTTGAGKKRVEEINRHADLVWSCGSEMIRESCGRQAIIQVSKAIPVFVMSREGVDFTSAYLRSPEILRGLAISGQYLISSSPDGGRKIRIGKYDYYISERKLPVRSRKEPC